MRSSLTFKYYAGDSLFHRMDARTKMLLLITWIATVLLFRDFRVLVVLFATSGLLLAATRIPWSHLRQPVLVMGIFILLNSILTNLLVPSYASRFVEVQTTLLQLGPVRVTAETAFYTLVLSLRYLSIFPVAMLFILTTDPTRIANGIYNAKLGYKAAFVFQIAFRYLPTVSHEYLQIVNAQRARGLRLDDKRVGVWVRVRQFARIVVPLLMSSLDRVDVVANAMDLRAFGTTRHRTWYHDGAFQRLDYATLAAMAVVLVLAIFLKLRVFSGFWLPW